jgi:hypothetical protein
MFIQSGSWPVGRKNTAFSGGTLLEEARRTVQKLCEKLSKQIMHLAAPR